VLKAALGKKADVEVLVIGAGAAPHGVTKKFSRFSIFDFFRRKLSRKSLMNLVFPLQFFGGNCKFLELFGSVAEIFWNFLELFGASWELTQAMQGRRRRGVEVRAPDRKKNISGACYNGRDRSPVMASDDPSRSAEIAIARSHGARLATW
jgi:hypothetical protein